MRGLERIWNGRPAGMIPALAIGLGIIRDRLGDKSATLFWRCNLGELGPGSRIQRDVAIRWPGRIKIGADCSIGTKCSLDSEHADSDLTICNGVVVCSNVLLDFSGGLVIGRNSLISQDVIILTHSHGHDPRSPSVKTPLLIEENVWIGARVSICEEVGRIARGSIIAAGAIVTREIAETGVYAGVPARLVKVLEPERR